MPWIARCRVRPREGPSIQLGEVNITKVVEIPRSTYTTSMLPDSSAAGVERHYTWLKPHVFDDAVGDLASRIQIYVVRTPEHTGLVDTGVGNDKLARTTPSGTGARTTPWTISPRPASFPSRSTSSSAHAQLLEVAVPEALDQNVEVPRAGRSPARARGGPSPPGSNGCFGIGIGVSSREARSTRPRRSADGGGRWPTLSAGASLRRGRCSPRRSRRRCGCSGLRASARELGRSRRAGYPRPTSSGSRSADPTPRRRRGRSGAGGRRGRRRGASASAPGRLPAGGRAGDGFDAAADLADGDHADEELLVGDSREPGPHVLVGSCALAELR